ncbi:MAG: cation diffusion facilitator family transporter, partial [Deferribacterales bacterium]
MKHCKDHNHHHHTVLKNTISTDRILFVILFNLLITLTEIIGGIFSGSLSLISDAFHNFSDAMAIIISYIAIKLGEKDNSLKHTFGLKRAEILDALLNSSILIG